MDTTDVTVCSSRPATRDIRPDGHGGFRQRIEVIERIGHPGPHEVGLGYGGGAGTTYDGRWVLKHSLELAEHGIDNSDQAEQIRADIALVTPLLTRRECRPYLVEATTEERDALRRILEECQEYWITCGYADDGAGTEEERVLGRLAEAHFPTGIGACFVREGRVQMDDLPMTDGNHPIG